MNLTQQITSQIDAVVLNIGKYSDAVQAENQRYTKAKADASTRSDNQKKAVQQQTDAQIKKLMDELQSIKDTQSKARQVVSSFEHELIHLVPRNQLKNIPQPSHSFSQWCRTRSQSTHALHRRWRRSQQRSSHCR